LAYVTQTAHSPATVWLTGVKGGARIRLGIGDQPVIAPSGQQVAASLYGTGGAPESGPALAVWGVGGGPIGAEPPLTYFNLAAETATPLAFSPDLRYLAVQLTSVANAASGSELAVIDLALSRRQTSGTPLPATVKTIARGQIYGASFAPDGSDRLVYGRANSSSLSAPVNLFLSNPDGSGVRALTRDGRSLNPVWGSRGIAYDKERLRGNDAPVFQIWLRSASGSRTRRLTNIRVRSLASGLVPLAFSTDGRRLLAEFEGQDTSEAWTVRVPTGRARRVTVRGRSVVGAGISRDGRTLLIEEGSFLEEASAGRVATVPFAGGRSRVLVSHGAQASWNA
jgi:Tol biopolymer transport system component